MVIVTCLSPTIISLPVHAESPDLTVEPALPIPGGEMTLTCYGVKGQQSGDLEIMQGNVTCGRYRPFTKTGEISLNGCGKDPDYNVTFRNASRSISPYNQGHQDKSKRKRCWRLDLSIFEFPTS